MQLLGGWGLLAEPGCLHTGGGARRCAGRGRADVVADAVRSNPPARENALRVWAAAGWCWACTGSPSSPCFLPLGHFAASTQLSLARSRALCSCPSTSHGSGCREPCLAHRTAAPAAPADLRTVPMGSARAASAPCASPCFFSLRKSSALGLLKSKVGENSTWTIPCTHRCAGPPAAIGASSPQPELAGSHHVVIPSPHTCTPRASAKLCPPLSLQKPLCQRPAETDRDERPLGAAHQLMPGALPPRGTAAASSPGAWLPP